MVMIQITCSLIRTYQFNQENHFLKTVNLQVIVTNYKDAEFSVLQNLRDNVVEPLGICREV